MAILQVDDPAADERDRRRQEKPMHSTTPFISLTQIAELAYRYWEDRGRPEGSPEVDWYNAIAVLGHPAGRALDADLISAFSVGPTTS
jgi:hypothetical protein